MFPISNSFFHDYICPRLKKFAVDQVSIFLSKSQSHVVDSKQVLGNFKIQEEYIFNKFLYKERCRHSFDFLILKAGSKKAIKQNLACQVWSEFTHIILTFIFIENFLHFFQHVIMISPAPF